MNTFLRTIIVLFTFQCIYISCPAQYKNYKVVYRHCLEMDTTRILTDTIGREAILTGNEKSSVYIFGKFINLEQPVQETSVNDMLQESNLGVNTYVVGTGRKFDAIGNMLYFDKKTDSLFTREKMINDYVILKEKRAVIKWSITKEEKFIINYLCQKAVGHFRGRTYTAWFTNSVNIIDGPWKFKGLPGLLVSLEDNFGQVKIYATSIELLVNEPFTKFIENGIPVSFEKYISYRDEEMHAQMSEMQMATPATTKIGLYGIERSVD